jgi:hypothetical protein
MSEMSIGTVISDEWFQDQEKRQSIERKMCEALPDDVEDAHMQWHPLEALDGSGDRRWVGNLIYTEAGHE